MITAVHTLIYSDDPTATRAFLKDVLRWPFVAELSERGATFSSGPTDLGFGMAAMVQVPGADDILIYEARHVTAYDS